MSKRLARAARNDDDAAACPPNIKAVHYYHNASYHSSQASCRTPTATTVTWQPAYSEEDTRSSKPDQEGMRASTTGGWIPPSPEKKRKSRARIPHPDYETVIVPSYDESSAAAMDRSPFFCGTGPLLLKSREQLEDEASTVVVNNRAKKGFSGMLQLAKRVLLRQPPLVPPPSLKATPAVWDNSHNAPPAPVRLFDGDEALTRAVALSPQEHERVQQLQYLQRQQQQVSTSATQICTTTIFDSNNNHNNTNDPVQKLQRGKVILSTIQHHPVDLDDTPPDESFESGIMNVNALPDPRRVATPRATTATGAVVVTPDIVMDEELAKALDMNNVTVDQALDGSFAFQQHELRLKDPTWEPETANNFKHNEDNDEEEDDDDDKTNELNITQVSVDDDSSFAPPPPPPPPPSATHIGRNPGPVDLGSKKGSFLTTQPLATAERRGRSSGPVDLDVTPEELKAAPITTRRDPGPVDLDDTPEDLDETPDYSLEDTVDDNDHDDDENKSFALPPPPQLHGRRSGPMARRQNNQLPPRPPTTPRKAPKEMQQEPQEHIKILKVFEQASHQHKQKRPPTKEAFTVGPVEHQAGVDGDELKSSSFCSILDMTEASSKPGIARANHVDESMDGASSKPGITMANHVVEESIDEPPVESDDENAFPTAGSFLFRRQSVENELKAAYIRKCQTGGTVSGAGQYSRPVDDEVLDDSLSWTIQRSFSAAATAKAGSSNNKTPLRPPRLAPSMRDSPSHFAGGLVSVTSQGCPQEAQSQAQPQPSTNTIMLKHSISQGQDDGSVATTQMDEESVECDVQSEAVEEPPTVVNTADAENNNDMLFQAATTDNSVDDKLSVDEAIEKVSKLWNATDEDETEELLDELDQLVDDIFEGLDDSKDDSSNPLQTTKESIRRLSSEPPQIRPKSWTERSRRLPPPAFKGTKSRLVPLWEEPLSRKRRGDGPVDLDDTVEISGVGTSKVYSGPVDLDDTVESSGVGTRKVYAGPVDLDDTVESSGVGTSKVYSGPVDLDDTVESSGVGTSKVYSGPVDLDDSVSTASSTDGGPFDEQDELAAPITGRKDADDKLPSGSNSSTIDWNAIVAASDSDDSNSDVFFTQVAVPSKENKPEELKSDSARSETKASLEPVLCASSDDDSRRAHTGAAVTQPRETDASYIEDADWFELAKTDDTKDSRSTHAKPVAAAVATPTATPAATPARLARPPKDTPSGSRRTRRLQSSKPDEPDCDFAYSASTRSLDGPKSELAPAFHEQPTQESDKVPSPIRTREVVEEALSCVSGSQASQAVSVKHAYKNDQDDDISSRSEKSTAQNASEGDPFADAGENDDENQEGEGFHPLDTSNESDSVSAGSLIREEFKDFSFEDPGDEEANEEVNEETAMEIERFKKLCMENAMNSSLARSEQQEDAAEDPVTPPSASAAEQLQTSMDHYASVIMELDSCIAPEPDLQDEQQPEDTAGGATISSRSGQEEASQPQDEASQPQDDETAVPICMLDIQEEIHKSLEVVAEARASFDVEKLENEIKKLQATVAALKAAQAGNTSYVAEDTTPVPVTPSVSAENSNSQCNSSPRYPTDESGSKTPNTPAMSDTDTKKRQRSASFTAASSSASTQSALSSGNEGDDEDGFGRGRGGEATTFSPDASRMTIDIGVGLDLSPASGIKDGSSPVSSDDVEKVDPVPETQGNSSPDSEVRSASSDESVLKAIRHDFSAEFDEDGSESAGSSSTQPWSNKRKASLSLGKRMVQAFHRLRQNSSQKGANAYSVIKTQRQESQAAEMMNQLKMKSDVVEQINRLRNTNRNDAPCVNTNTGSLHVPPKVTSTTHSDSESLLYKDAPTVASTSTSSTDGALLYKDAKARLKPIPPSRADSTPRWRATKLPTNPEGQAVFAADFSKLDPPGQHHKPGSFVADFAEYEEPSYPRGGFTIAKQPNRLIPDTADFTFETENAARKQFELEDRMISYLLEGIYAPVVEETTAVEERQLLKTDCDKKDVGLVTPDPELRRPTTETKAAPSPSNNKSTDSRRKDKANFKQKALDCSSDNSLATYQRRERSSDPLFEQLVESLVQQAVDSDTDTSNNNETSLVYSTSRSRSATGIKQPKAQSPIVVETVGDDEEFSVVEERNSENEAQQKPRSTPRTPHATKSTTKKTPSSSKSKQTPTSSKSREAPWSSKANASPILEGIDSVLRDLMTGFVPLDVPEVFHVNDEEEEEVEVHVNEDEELEANLNVEEVVEEMVSKPDPREMSISEAQSIECVVDWSLMQPPTVNDDEQRSLTPPTIPEHSDNENTGSPPAKAKTGDNDHPMTESSPAGFTDPDSFYDRTMSLEDSSFSHDTDESSFGNAPRSLASDEEISPRRLADSGFLRKAYNLERSDTPKRNTRKSTARNDTPSSRSNSDTSEDNLLNPIQGLFENSVSNEGRHDLN